MSPELADLDAAYDTERAALDAAFAVVKATSQAMAEDGIFDIPFSHPWQVLDQTLVARLDVYDVLRIAWRTWNDEPV